MMNEKVEVQIGSRQLVVEIPDLFPAEIGALAKKVSERMADLQTQNISVGDSSKIALLVALSFAADLERERQTNGSIQRAGIAGRVAELSAPDGEGDEFRAVLAQENAEPIRLRIHVSLMNTVCRAFVSKKRINLTGHIAPRDEQNTFIVEEIARPD